MHQTSTKLVDVLSQELILPAIRAVKRDAVIRELAAHLAERTPDLNEHEVAEAIRERERQGSTAIGEGVALPHAKLGSVDTIAACLGRSLKGVDFGSQDGKPTHFFFMVISTVDSAGSHLRLLARFSQLFKSAEFRARLMSAESAKDMYTLIAEEDSK